MKQFMFFCLIFIMAMQAFCMTDTERLAELKSLFEKKIISEQEYLQAKKEILNQIMLDETQMKSVVSVTAETIETAIKKEPAFSPPPPPSSLKIRTSRKTGARGYTQGQHDIIVMPFVNETGRRLETDGMLKRVVDHLGKASSLDVCPAEEILKYMGTKNMFDEFWESDELLAMVAKDFNASYIVCGSVIQLNSGKKIQLFTLPFWHLGLGFVAYGRCELSVRVWSPKSGEFLFTNSASSGKKKNFLAFFSSRSSMLNPAVSSCINTVFHRFVTRID